VFCDCSQPAKSPKKQFGGETFLIFGTHSKVPFCQNTLLQCAFSEFLAAGLIRRIS